jgi:hypothetical protein
MYRKTLNIEKQIVEKLLNAVDKIALQERRWNKNKDEHELQGIISKAVEKHRTIILQITTLLSTSLFLDEVNEIRKLLQLPLPFSKEQFNQEKRKISRGGLIVDESSPFAKLFLFGVQLREILDSCAKLNLEESVFKSFIYDLVVFDEITIPSPNNEHLQGLKGDFTYKTELVRPASNDMEALEFQNRPLRGFITFYSDTDISKLKTFIEDNHKAIKEIQKELDPYPFSGVDFKEFYRDYRIFLYINLGYSYDEISRKIAAEGLGTINEKQITKINTKCLSLISKYLIELRKRTQQT